MSQPFFPTTPATPDPDTPAPVLSKDVPLNSINNTSLRIFLPKKSLQSSPNSQKLPIIVYYHGGGFIYLSASSSMNHDFCFKLAEMLSVVVVSVDYRLAPVSRLPAAYDDGVEALQWLRTTDDKWVREFGDITKCFLMGTSAGGNMVYHVGLRVLQKTIDDFDFEPLKIRGLILHHPFFGGAQRTESELRLINDEVLPLKSGDMMWELSLPEGEDRDHKYCNPTVLDEDIDKCFDQIKLLRWKVLVTGCYGDPLFDRQVEFVEILRRKGVEVEEYFGDGCHGMEALDLNSNLAVPARFLVILHIVVCDDG
ncbi:unnamed protein product [Lupinus luteus]|uniref:Alpha/beta hydrolase fold-3 domain-containing protein n=1 Tax=Lupinus luteus TaxID=3873 RepID=A0AAV1YJZ6_LUPLU